MKARADAAAMLGRALAASARRDGLALEAKAVRTRSWASATFAGERVTMRVELAGGAAWLAALPEADLPMPGRFVAELAVLGTDAGGATVEALVLDAA